MADIITYEQFCAARKAKMEKIEVVELDWSDEQAAIAEARDFYAEKDRVEQDWRDRYDYE